MCILMQKNEKLKILYILRPTQFFTLDLAMYKVVEKIKKKAGGVVGPIDI